MTCVRHAFRSLARDAHSIPHLRLPAQYHCLVASDTGSESRLARLFVNETERLRRSWIANAPAWCDAVRNQRIESRREVTDAAIVDAVLQRKPRRVLDLGCGEGWLARALHAHGIEVTGVDASVPLIEAANASGGGTFIAAGYDEIIANPSLAGTSFDVFVANFALLDDRTEELLRALHAALSGYLIVQTVHPLAAVGDGPYEDGWRTETFTAFPGNWPESMPWYFRTLESWQSLFARAGYTVVETHEPTRPGHSLPASVVFVCTLARRPAP